MKIFAFPLAAVLLTSSVLAGATTLIDGSFETKGAATPVTDYCYDGMATPGGSACAAGAWTGNGVIRSGSGPWGATTTPAGDYYGFIQGAGALSQGFTATSTGTLALTWLDAGRGNNGSAQTYVVTLSRIGFGDIVDLGTYSTGVGQAFTARNSRLFSVVGGGEYRLTFGGLSTDDRTSFIDDVALSAVPEPSSWALLIGGFGMVGSVLRRRRTALAA